MTARGLMRAVGCAALAAFLGAALLALLYGLRPSLRIEFDRELPRLVGGIYPFERDEKTGLTFAWSGREVVLRLRGLDRRANWTLDARVRGARADPAQNPALEFYVDGVLLDTRQSTVDFGDMRVIIPARPEQRGAVITMRPSRTFNPGPSDPRDLGVMFDRITLTPSTVVFPPRPTVGAIAIAAGVIGAALALIGLSLATAVGGAVAIAAGASAVVANGFAPYSAFPSTAVTLALWTSGLTVAIGRAIEWHRGTPLRNTARFAIAFSACAVFLKLLALLHPNMPVGDALFHAHRYRTVVDGNLFFTSIAPGNYQFPYAPGLYVAAAPFAEWVTRDSGDMSLLRIFVAVADGVAGALLYLMIVRAWGDRLAAALGVALYHLAPLGFGVVRTGNLTNAFAQSLAVVGLVMIANPALRWERRLYIACLAALLAAAFMSHTSTFAIVFPACVLIAAAFWWKGGPALRSPAAAVMLAGGVALVASVALYYAHFGDTYRAEFARITTETATSAPDAGGRTALDRLTSVPRYLRLYFDVPLILLACLGAWRLYVRRARDRGALATLGWAAACALFFVIGIVTPVDMRYYLAVIPAFAVAGGAGASWLWTSGSLHRVLALALLAWAAVTGAANILTW
jgi:hypothetical protein